MSPDISDDDICMSVELAIDGTLNGATIKPMVTQTVRAIRAPNNRFMVPTSHSSAVLKRTLYSRLRDSVKLMRKTVVRFPLQATFAEGIFAGIERNRTQEN